jgi:hypothetical protein
MRKILFLLLINCVGLSAQFRISGTVGANYSKFNPILFGKEYYNDVNKYYKYQLFPNLGIELSYQRNQFIYLTGISYSYRGGRDYNIPNQIWKSRYLIDINGYIEIPLQVSYSYFQDKLSSGLGVILHKRTYTGTSYYEERNKFYGLDFRVTSAWNINRRFAISPAYTLGNLDKYILNTKGNFLHHVFSLNLKYTFVKVNG